MTFNLSWYDARGIQSIETQQQDQYIYSLINVEFFHSAAKVLLWTHTRYLPLFDWWINNICIN